MSHPWLNIPRKEDDNGGSIRAKVIGRIAKEEKEKEGDGKRNGTEDSSDD